MAWTATGADALLADILASVPADGHIRDQGAVLDAVARVARQVAAGGRRSPRPALDFELHVPAVGWWSWSCALGADPDGL